MSESYKARRIFHFAASAKLNHMHSGGLCTNRGAVGAITLTLPPGAEGLDIRVVAIADHDITVDPDGTDILNDIGVPLVAGQYQKIDDVGGELHYIHDGTSWCHLYERGTITNE